MNVQEKTESEKPRLLSWLRTDVPLYHYYLLVVELVLAVVTFCLFWNEYVGDLRPELWELGGKNGWNSNPKLRLYYYANHREPPPVPLVWSVT